MISSESPLTIFPHEHKLNGMTRYWQDSASTSVSADASFQNCKMYINCYTHCIFNIFNMTVISTVIYVGKASSQGRFYSPRKQQHVNKSCTMVRRDVFSTDALAQLDKGWY